VLLWFWLARAGVAAPSIVITRSRSRSFFIVRMAAPFIVSLIVYTLVLDGGIPTICTKKS
jgi:hypothetical protein